MLKEEFQKTINKKAKCLITKSEIKNLIEQTNTEGISTNLTLKELISVIKKSNKGKAYGPDEISYKFFKNAPIEISETIVKLFNNYWLKGEYPKVLKKSLVNPILKPGKDPTEIKSYRFISRISCIGKLFESMITNRLNWWLETNNKLNEDLTGFRPNSSTIDALQIIDFQINKTFTEKKYALIACLDLEKAFDNVNHEAIIIKAAKLGIVGTPLKWIMDFLNNRTYQIVIGNKKTEEENIARGLPQGSPLSPLLFNIMTTDLTLTEGLKKVTYADDITIIAINKNLAEAKNILEIGLKQTIEWANKWELLINLTKSKLMCFTKNKIREIPVIKIDNKELKFTTNHTILGLEFDAPKLTCKNQINNLKINCSNRIFNNMGSK